MEKIYYTTQLHLAGFEPASMKCEDQIALCDTGPHFSDTGPHFSDTGPQMRSQLVDGKKICGGDLPPLESATH